MVLVLELPVLYSPVGAASSRDISLISLPNQSRLEAAPTGITIQINNIAPVWHQSGHGYKCQ